MTIFPPVLSSLIVIALSSCPVYSHISTIPANQNISRQRTLAQTQTVQVPITLTDLAEITLKDKTSKLGRLTNVDPQKQNFTITRDNQSETIATKQIQKVTFLKLVGGTRKPLAPPKGEERTWSGIPLENLKIQGNGDNKAEVSLPVGIDPKIGSDQDNVYVIKELTFPAANKMNMQVYVYK